MEIPNLGISTYWWSHRWKQWGSSTLKIRLLELWLNMKTWRVKVEGREREWGSALWWMWFCFFEGKLQREGWRIRGGFVGFVLYLCLALLSGQLWNSKKKKRILKTVFVCLVWARERERECVWGRRLSNCQVSLAFW